MALTRITKGVIKPNENYDTHNIVSTGIVTSVGLDVNGNGDISGNLSVGGVLTYEDVTSIDSVGIITAQKDIHVGAGVSAVGVGTFGGLDINGDIDVDGHTNLDNVSIAGVTTFAGAITANGAIDLNSDLDVDGHTNLDNVSIAGVTTATGNITILSAHPKLLLTDDTNPDFSVHVNGGSFHIRNETVNRNDFRITSDGTNELYHGGNERLATTSTGVQIDTILKLYGAAGNPGKLQLSEGGATSDIRVERSTDTSSALLFGTEISGTTATRAKIDTAGHFIPATDSTYDLGLTGTRWRNVYADTLYGDGSNLTGITQTTINSNTNNYIITGTGTANELQGESELQWNGSNLFVRAGEATPASLNLIADQGDDNGDGWKIQSEQDENDLTFKSNISGSYVDKLKLKSNGQLEVQGNIISTGKASFPDGNSNGVTIGNKSGGDLRIFHNGSNSYLENDTGNLVIDNGSGVDMYINSGNDIYIRPQGSQNGIVINGAGRVELYHNNSMKFWTQSWGAQLAGNFIPNGTNAYDLGASNERWRNIYTNDLHLSNEGSTNSIDNTWGDWTLQEGESDVYMINNRSGKKFKIKMEEVK